VHPDGSGVTVEKVDTDLLAPEGGSGDEGDTAAGEISDPDRDGIREERLPIDDGDDFHFEDDRLAFVAAILAVQLGGAIVFASEIREYAVQSLFKEIGRK